MLGLVTEMITELAILTSCATLGICLELQNSESNWITLSAPWVRDLHEIYLKISERALSNSGKTHRQVWGNNQRKQIWGFFPLNLKSESFLCKQYLLFYYS